MRVDGLEALHPVAAEARREPVDKRVEIGIARGAAVEIRRLWRERLRRRHLQPQRIEAEAGVDRVGKRVHPLAEEPEQQRRIAAGRPVSTLRLRTAPSVRKTKASNRRPPRPRLSKRRAISATRRASAAINPSESSSGAGKRRSAAQSGGRAQRRDAPLLAAEQAVELQPRACAEAGAERGGRQGLEVAYPAEAGAGERERRLRRQFHCCDRQAAGERRRLAGRDNPAPREAGEGAGGVRPIGEGGPRLDAAAGEGGDHAVTKARLAAEEMGAARDVEDQPVGRLDRDHRREAAAEERDLLEEAFVGLGIGRGGGERGDAGAGVGERQAGAEPQLRRRPVHGLDAQRALRLGD